MEIIQYLFLEPIGSLLTTWVCFDPEPALEGGFSRDNDIITWVVSNASIVTKNMSTKDYLLSLWVL